MTGRLGRGFRLARSSFGVLKTDRELVVLPLLSMVTVAVVSVPFIAAIAGMATIDGPSPFVYLLGVLDAFVVAAVGIFFKAAIVAAATVRFDGGDATIGAGMRLASMRAARLVVWAALTTTVGTVLRALERRAGFLGDIVISIVGAAWNTVTFLVVPVLLFEPLGVGDAVKRSAALFRERWGEQVVGNVSIAGAVFLCGLPVIFVSFMLPGPAGLALFVLTIVTMIAVGGAMSGIFCAALYRFATTGEAPASFDRGDLVGSFRPR